MREIFHFQGNENYHLRSGTHLVLGNMRTTLFGKETVSNLGTKIWPLLPQEFQNASSLPVFKSNVREWKLTDGPLGFVRHIYSTNSTRQFYLNLHRMRILFGIH